MKFKKTAQKNWRKLKCEIKDTNIEYRAMNVYNTAQKVSVFTDSDDKGHYYTITLTFDEIDKLAESVRASREKVEKYEY